MLLHVHVHVQHTHTYVCRRRKKIQCRNCLTRSYVCRAKVCICMYVGEVSLCTMKDVDSCCLLFSGRKKKKKGWVCRCLSICVQYIRAAPFFDSPLQTLVIRNFALLHPPFLFPPPPPKSRTLFVTFETNPSRQSVVGS